MTSHGLISSVFFRGINKRAVVSASTSFSFIHEYLARKIKKEIVVARAKILKYLWLKCLEIKVTAFFLDNKQIKKQLKSREATAGARVCVLADQIFEIAETIEMIARHVTAQKLHVSSKHKLKRTKRTRRT
jgi:hypothetical protein